MAGYCLRFAGVVLLAGGLSGCIGTASEGGGARSGGTADSFRLAVFGNPENHPPELPAGPQREYTCPSVDIMEGAAAYRVGGAGGVAHQASIIDVARECAISGTQMSMKIGVQGRMLLGATGKAGSYTVPVRVAVKRGDTVVTSRVARVQVAITGGETGASFTHIEENIVLPISQRDPADEYDVFIGFDAGGGAADPRKGRRRR